MDQNCVDNITVMEDQLLHVLTGSEEERKVNMTCTTCSPPVLSTPADWMGMQDLMEGTQAGAPLPCDLCHDGNGAKLSCSTCNVPCCVSCRRPQAIKPVVATHHEDVLRQGSEPGSLRETLGIIESLLQTMATEEAWTESPTLGHGFLADDHSSPLARLPGQQQDPDDAFTNLALLRSMSVSESPQLSPRSHKYSIAGSTHSVFSTSAQETETTPPGSPVSVISRRESESAWSPSLSRCESTMIPQSVVLSLTSALKRSLEKQLETERAVSGLQQQLAELQRQNALQHRELALLHEKDSHNEQEIARERDALSSVQREVVACRDDVTTLQNDANKMQDFALSLKQAQSVLESARGACKHVAFHAILSTKTKLNKRDVLVCDEVVSNVDNGYNAKIGVFVAPVAGTYCFMATSSPGSDDDFVQCKLDLMVGERDIAFLSARGKASCTTHAVVKVSAGHRAYLRANEDGKFAGGWRTSFTGILVQPEV